MRRLTLFILLLVAVALDCAVLTRLTVLGWSPSLSLCVIVSIAVTYGPAEGMIAGLCAGLMLDMLFAPARGFYSIANLLTGYVAGAVFRRGMREEPVMVGVLMVAMYLVREVISGVMALLLSANLGNVFWLLLRYLLPSALFTGGVGILLFFPLRALMHSGYMRRKRSFD